MKILKTGFMLFRNKHTESLQPFIFKTLARCIFFPDGKSLLEKWKEEINTSLLVRHEYENKIAENKSIYKWSCCTFEGEKYQLVGHFKPNMDPSNHIVIAGHGKVGAINRYKFEIPLPTDFKKERKIEYRNNSTVIFSEGENSTFIEYDTMHSVKVQKKDASLLFIIDHYIGQDQVDLSELKWITFDINIIVDGMFMVYSTGSNGAW